MTCHKTSPSTNHTNLHWFLICWKCRDRAQVPHFDRVIGTPLFFLGVLGVTDVEALCLVASHQTSPCNEIASWVATCNTFCRGCKGHQRIWRTNCFYHFLSEMGQASTATLRCLWWQHAQMTELRPGRFVKRTFRGWMGSEVWRHKKNLSEKPWKVHIFRHNVHEVLKLSHHWLERMPHNLNQEAVSGPLNER